MRAIHRSTCNLLLAAALAALLPTAALAAELDGYPETGAAATALYEGNPDTWLDGPVQYLILDAERKQFERLQTTAERQRFIEWFWDRRDDDLADDKNPARIAFYERVAEANDRYADFPRGWKSDRGLVHVMLGRPDGMRPQFGYAAASVVWTYYTVGPRARDRAFGSAFGEIQIAFVRQNHRGGYEIYGGFGGPGQLPLYVRDAFRYVRQAVIVDPFLELDLT